jgi:hypothetical protein
MRPRVVDTTCSARRHAPASSRPSTWTLSLHFTQYAFPSAGVSATRTSARTAIHGGGACRRGQAVDADRALSLRMPLWPDGASSTSWLTSLRVGAGGQDARTRVRVSIPPRTRTSTRHHEMPDSFDIIAISSTLAIRDLAHGRSALQTHALTHGTIPNEEFQQSSS